MVKGGHTEELKIYFIFILIIMILVSKKKRYFRKKEKKLVKCNLTSDGTLTLLIVTLSSLEA